MYCYHRQISTQNVHYLQQETSEVQEGHKVLHLKGEKISSHRSRTCLEL